MNDRQLCKELQDFANDHTLAHDIQVTVEPGRVSMRPRLEGGGMKYEDTQLLGDLIQGAEHYLFWKMRKANAKKKK